MKTLEQTLEELKQLETVINSGLDKLTDDQLNVIVNQLESAYTLAFNELENVEKETLDLSAENKNNEQ